MTLTKKHRKSSKKNTPKSVVKPAPYVPCYLAIPKDENDWIRYRGRCMLFSGKFIEDELWVMEPEDVTKTKLAIALEKAGIKCESISFDYEDTKDGVRYCNVICAYNKPYEPYNDDFYLPGLTTFDWMYLERDPSEYQLEFCLFDVI